MLQSEDAEGGESYELAESGPAMETEVIQPGGGVVRKKRPLADTFAAKKTVAQGMMDVALITANANQLKFVITFGAEDSFSYYVVIVLIVVSLILQVAVGVSLVFKGKCDLGGESKLERANRINNFVVAGVFLITIVNVFIAAFSDTGTQAPMSKTT